MQDRAFRNKAGGAGLERDTVEGERAGTWAIDGGLPTISAEMQSSPSICSGGMKEISRTPSNLWGSEGVDDSFLGGGDSWRRT